MARMKIHLNYNSPDSLNKIKNIKLKAAILAFSIYVFDILLGELDN